MLQSQLFYKSLKEKSVDAESVSHELLTRAGFIDQLMAGVYTFSPLGFLVLQKIEGIIRNNMQLSPANGQEILMPVLQPKENWQKTGRWENLDVLFKIKGKSGREYALGPTHEEVVVPLAKKIINSYKDLPVSLFQIQTKFRDELRAKSGILRTREFLMKDLYSFHSTQDDLDKYYEKMIKVYFNIFKECGIYKSGRNRITYETLASGGTFSKYSTEFQTITESGEDIIYICEKCQIAINKEIKKENIVCPNCKSADFREVKAVEVGNIFKLGTKFSQVFDLKFRAKDGKENLVIMGCYGLGLGRILGAIVEINHDEKGIVWPENVAPFDIHLIQIGDNAKVGKEAKKIYENLLKNNISALYDDRKDKSAGEKFAEADLIGIPKRMVISEKTLEEKSVEVKKRSEQKIKLIKIDSIND